VTAPVQLAEGDRRLLLDVTDTETQSLTPARFSLLVDGQNYIPAALDKNGLRFVSIHEGKQQRFVVTYTRGVGPVAIPLPPAAKRGVVFVAKGFEYLSVETPFEVQGITTHATVSLRRWSDLQRRGWLPADEHLHYERLDPSHDHDWLTMLAADGLTHAHFLVLKGGNLPGVWAQQFAYGKQGEGSDGQRLIRAGEEYRDGSQGHINLLGLSQVIEPISTGGIGGPATPHNYPPFSDVFRRSRELGGIGGVAHGAALSRSPTAVADTVLGTVDFFEIANTHLYKTDVWYRLLNCGYITPPAAGTDLPNFPFRDWWQPFLGEIRMYVRVGQSRDFDSWKAAVARGEVIISSGPLIEFTINGVGPGGTIRLPAGGGEVDMEAELASPRTLRDLEIVQNSQVVPMLLRRVKDNDIQRLQIRQRLRVETSCWLAARGVGEPKQALASAVRNNQDTIAHTAAVQVIVGDQPIMSQLDVEQLRRQLIAQHEYYRSEGRFERAEHRARFLEQLDKAMKDLERLTAK